MDSHEPSLYVWGAQVPDGAVGFLPDGKPLIESGSAERMLRLLGRIYDVDLLWLDDPAVN